MGFDGGTNQGRVWLSPDGISWSEPASGLFAAYKSIGVLEATSRWYLTTGTEPGRGEGDLGGPTQLYRSADGRHWDAVGVATNERYSYRAVGDVFLRQSNDGTSSAATTIEVSDDAEHWTVLKSSGLDQRPLDVSDTSALAHVGARIYARSIGLPDSPNPHPLPLILGTSDAQSWQALDPQPPSPVGSLAGVDNGLVTVSNNVDECLYVPDQDPDPRLQLCGRHQIVRFLASGSRQWVTLTSSAPATPDVWAPITSFGGQLVQFVLGLDRHVTVATSADGRAWSVPPDLSIDTLRRDEPDRRHGASWPPLLATSGTTIVGVATIENASGRAGFATNLIIGTLRSATAPPPVVAGNDRS
jgi:hypothetical protein